ncbi:MAG: ribonuclease Z [Flavobacteriaceae bacterium]|nr:ribonuclease Z [Flavobacteriaceae bacterium]
MKKITLLLVLLITATAFSQTISGKAYYESKTTIDMDNIGSREMSEDIKKMIADRMKSMLEKTFILTFNNTESIYKEEEKLAAGGGNPFFGAMMSSFTAGAQYKNLEENLLLEEREFFGKEFLIKDSLSALSWEVGKESKQIGQYIAIKATAVKKIDENDFSMARRRNRDNNDAEKKEAAKDQDTVKKEAGDPWDEIEVPKEVIVTAWFTPQIPVGNGPGEYAGLPGLILELNAYRTTILCSKIILNPSDAETIEPPKKGDKVTRAEFNALVKEKMEEMRENFRGRGGRRGGRG